MGKKNKSSDGKTSTSLRWAVNMDKVFLDALINEDVNGNRVDGQFTSKAYENVVRECTEKLGHPFTKENLKNRLKTIKSNFNEVYDLFNASGWGWNEVTELFENEDEVWNDLIEKKPDVAKWKTTPFRHYDLLLQLFSKDRATGDVSGTVKERKLKAMAESSANKQEESKESIGEQPEPSETSDSSSLTKGKKRKVGEMFIDELSSIKDGLDNVAQALREGNMIVERGRAQVYSPQEVFDELTRMEFDPTNRRKAYRFLNAKQSRIRELFGCPPEERKAYLMEMLVEDD